MSVARRTFLRRAGLLAAGAAGALLGACQQPTNPSRSTDTRPPELRTAEPRPTPTPAPKPGAELKPGGTGTPSGQTAPVAGPPKPGGSVVWAIEADPGTLDPYAGAGPASIRVWADLAYQSLVMFDENLKLTPCLAETWVNTGPTTWTFKLRRGVRFHDGSEFEAEDVRAWFEHVMSPRTVVPARPRLTAIAKVEPKGRHEIEVSLRGPHAPLLGTFAALAGTAIVSRKSLGGPGAGGGAPPLGTGPYKIAEHVPNSHVRYVKHADYWESGLPYLDEVVLKIVPDEQARVAALRTGDVTYARIGPESAQRLKNERALLLLSAPGATQWMTVLNTKRAPFDDVRVRRALALAVDRQAAIATLLKGEARLTGPVPSGLGDLALPPDALPYRPDLARARQLMEEAGRASGFEATVLTPAGSSGLRSGAALLAEQVKPLGINVKVESADAATLLRALDARQFELAMTTSDFLPDPDEYLTIGYQPRSPLELSGWANPKYDELVNTARTILDPGQRKALYAEASGILLDEAPAIWWLAANTVEALNTSVKGYSPSFTGRWPGLKKVWLAG